MKTLLFVVALAVAVAAIVLLLPDDPPEQPVTAPVPAVLVAPPVETPPEPIIDAGRVAPPIVADGYCTETKSPVIDFLFEESDAGVHVRSVIRHAGEARSDGRFRRRAEVDPWFDLYLKAMEPGGEGQRIALLRRARAIAPHEPGLALQLAWATRNDADLDEAVDGVSTALESYPFSELAQLEARLELARDIQRGYLRESRDGVTLLWPAATVTSAQAREILWEIDRSLDAAAALTGTERRLTLTVVIYPSRSELLAVGCVPSWAQGLYDGTLRLAPSADGAIDMTSVRHETLHAQMESRSRRSRFWFSEGVAQAFSAKPVRGRSWALMLRNRTWIPFESLDETFTAFEGSADANLAYAQAWAMVELMRECGGDAAIAVAQKEIGEGLDTPTVLAHACHRNEVSGEDLLDFLTRRLASTDAH